MNNSEVGDQVEFDHHGKRCLGMVSKVAPTQDNLLLIQELGDPESGRPRWFVRLASEVRRAE